MRTPILILTVIMLFSIKGWSQKPIFSENQNFYELQAQMNDYYKKNPSGSGQTQWKRKEWFYGPRVFPSGKMNGLKNRIFQAQENYLKQNTGPRSVHGSWSFLGPTDHINPGQFAGGKGRINAFAIHPTNSQIIYAATSGGGLWRTANGGTTWVNKASRLQILSISDVGIDPANTNRIFVATGDADGGEASAGILESFDEGSTWHSTSVNTNILFPGETIHKILINPDSSNVQFVATSGRILRTTDHWSTFTAVYAGRTFDIEFKPGNTGQLYSSGISSMRRSTDGGINWSIISDGVLSSVNGSTRTEMAVSPAFPNGVYFIKVSGDSMRGIFRSLGSGIANSWTLIDTASSRLGGQGNYNLAMAVRSDDFNTVFAGLVKFGSSTGGGFTGSWTETWGAHPDNHDLQFVDGALYCANDGGLYKSTNNGTSWTEISKGIQNTEIYRMAGTPQNSDLYTIGCQDNGTMKRSSNSTVFNTIGGADGMTTMIDYLNQDNIIISGQSGFYYKTNDGGPAQINITPGDAGIWVTPGIMDPVDPEILFIGKDSIYRSTNQGDSWSWFSSPDSQNVSVLAQGVSNRNRLYVSREFKMWRHDAALSVTGHTATWTDISSCLPFVWISDIVVNPNNSLEVYVTLSGFGDGEKVYKSIDGGQCWDNISGSLPNVPINCIAYQDNGSNDDPLYIGTDIGVFYRDNQIGDWIYFSNLLPAVSVTDLYINNQNNTIAASTYGRGLWRSDVYTPCVWSVTIPSTIFNIPVIYGGVRYYSAINSIISGGNHYLDVGTEIHYQSGNYIDLQEGFKFGGEGVFTGQAGLPCPSGN